MRRARIAKGGSYHPTRKSCIACKGKTDFVGTLSRRGLCESCALSHQLAQWLGLSYVEYWDEAINNGIRLSYTGPVLKSA